MKAKRLAALIALIMTFAVFALTLSPSAAALTDKQGSITLNVKDVQTDAPLADTAFRLYFFAKAYDKVGDIGYELIDPYGEANADISDLQDAYLSVHLAYFAESRGLPCTEKKTDADGILVFDKLDAGLYLIVPVENAEGKYVSSPFIIAVPEYDSYEKSWNYNVGATPKIDGGADDSGKDTYISVVKKWETDGEIPESITVVLLRDFKEYAKIELSEDNDWHYRWDKLSREHVWSVVETHVPDGFKVYYDTSANTVTVINKAEGEGTTKPDEGTSLPSDGDDDGKDDLIHTGQLNWPVPVCAIAGLLLFAIGWATLNLGKKESE